MGDNGCARHRRSAALPAAQPPGLEPGICTTDRSRGLKTRFAGLKVRGWHRIAVAFAEKCELSELCELSPGMGWNLSA